MSWVHLLPCLPCSALPWNLEPGSFSFQVVTSSHLQNCKAMLRLASLRAGLGARRQLQAGAWAPARGVATGTEEQVGGPARRVVGFRVLGLGPWVWLNPSLARNLASRLQLSTAIALHLPALHTSPSGEHVPASHSQPLAACAPGLPARRPQEVLASKLRHTAEAAAHTAEEVAHKVEEVVHRAEEAVLSPLHKAQHFVHEHREHAQEEAERGMFTADDIQEAEALRAEAEAAHRRPLRGPHQVLPLTPGLAHAGAR